MFNRNSCPTPDKIPSIVQRTLLNIRARRYPPPLSGKAFHSLTLLCNPPATAIMSSAAALVVPAVKRHTSTVIMAHGLGDRYLLGSARLRREVI